MTIETDDRPGPCNAAGGRADVGGWTVVLVPVLIMAAGCGPNEVGSVKPPEAVSRGSLHNKGPAAKGPRYAPGWVRSRSEKVP